MKILLINKFHFPGSGAERAYFDTARILEKRGHTVAFFSMFHPKNVPTRWSQYFAPFVDYKNPPWGFLARARRALNIVWNFEAAHRLEELIRDFRPDAAHLHNIYHQLSPSIIWMLRKNRVPMVMTLHDYKIISPNYSMFSRGRIWEKPAWRCMLDGCVKDSRVKSMACVVEHYLHKALGTYKRVDAYIAPSIFLGKKFQRHGFSKKVSCVPQPITPNTANTRKTANEKHLLFFGRLSSEKGVAVLLRAMSYISKEWTLAIVGDGPDRGQLEKSINQNELRSRVAFLGALFGDELRAEISRAAAICFPSVWYENMPYALLEALSMGKIVIASRVGGIPERIEDGINGFLFEAGNARQLSEKIMSLSSVDAEKISHEAKMSVSGLTEGSYYNLLMGVLTKIIVSDKV